jgi:DNA-binding response OmpR family regulator
MISYTSKLIDLMMYKLRRATMSAERCEITRHSARRLCESGAMRINLAQREVWFEEALVHLTKSEFDVLAVLASCPGQVFTREQIVKYSKGGNYPVTQRSIDVQIVGLRRKLKQYADRIRTVRGAGYQLVEAPLIGGSESTDQRKSA